MTGRGWEMGEAIPGKTYHQGFWDAAEGNPMPHAPTAAYADGWKAGDFFRRLYDKKVREEEAAPRAGAREG